MKFQRRSVGLDVHARSVVGCGLDRETGEVSQRRLTPSREEVRDWTVRQDRLLAALPAGHRLTQRKSLTVADLRDEDFVAHAGAGRSVMGSVLSTACADAGFIPRVRQEVEETSTLVTLVAAGLGVAIVPAPTAALDIGGVSYRRLQPRTLAVDLVAAWLGSIENPMIPRVLRALESLARTNRRQG